MGLKAQNFENVIFTFGCFSLKAAKSPTVKAFTNYKKQHRTLRSLRKNKNNNFIVLIRSISRSGELVMFQFKNTLVNDGDMKVIANKF